MNYDRKSTLPATTFTYPFAGRVSGVIRDDTTTKALTAEPRNGLASPGTGDDL